jgi:hypothetical protein
MSLLCQRKSCIEVPTFSTGAQELLKTSPIRVAPKAKRRKSLLHVVLDDRGFPDQSNNYDHLLHGMDGGPILRKLRHPQPNLDAPLDPLYYLPFVADKHEALMRKGMDLMYLDLTLHLPPANILGFFGRIKKHQVFSPAAADETLHALKLFLKLGK